ncbi:tryptophan dimethylallyltransferase family protein [Streptomyces sp. NPDC014986]|uniref:tryptophan dimethylallyltransferase family protein n=1 Tax=Streptomyces sp. NPDC014986 TaxID=3364934 RepID=UPI0036FA3228
MAPSNHRQPNHPSTATASAQVVAGATLGERVGGQLRRVCRAAGFTDPDGVCEAPRLDLLDLLGPAARRPLCAGPPSPSFVCDDHSPVEFSLAFTAGSGTAVRVLAEPGCTAATLEENGRLGLRALEALASRRAFSTEPVRRVEDLFFPAVHGPFALWCAMDLRQGRPPGFKVYVNPQAHGRERAARVVEEALSRFGFGRAWRALRERAMPRGPERDEILFFALDLGRWHAPRVKVYVAHHDATAAEVHAVSRLLPGDRAGRVGEFCRVVGGAPRRFAHRPLVSCLSYTERDLEHPSGYTVHVPVRDYARNDGIARNRAVAVLRSHGMDTAVIDRALAAMTSRRPSDGVGLIAYVSLVRSTWQPTRVNVYFSPEAYGVRPPYAKERRRADAVADARRRRTTG